MVATQTVPQDFQSCNSTSIVPHRGVVTLFGYGIKVHVDRGHLTIHDGIGSARREARLPRVGHGLRRLVVIGSDGIVSLSALRWMASQNVAFVMLERDGCVLATTGPVRPSDVRLRRAQALAHTSGTALEIARELLDQKLVAQERLIREKLHDTGAADQVAEAREKLASGNSIERLRFFEAQGARAYWSAWRNLPIVFPNKDIPRVPGHWRTFGFRVSPLTGSPRLAVNPPNAMLNYLYAVLESEARLAAAALGLDPGMGVLHMDTPARDSLACDLMEPIRPRIDAYVLDWITRDRLRREWFFEERNGNCRLMASFAVRLSETAPTWARAVAPLAEGLCRALWSAQARPRDLRLPTHLTQSHRREVRGGPSLPNAVPLQTPPRICKTCGAQIDPRSTYCAACTRLLSRDTMIEAAKLGRIATHSPKAEALRGATQRRQRAGQRAWKLSDLPEWLTEDAYREKIQPKLATFTVSAIASALEISKPYATDIRSGKRVPHPRHRLTLAHLVGLV
ncbi:MAG: CRISPR-associated endonuclease Cas1 [Candidatus Acidiferrales bacterium]